MTEPVLTDTATGGLEPNPTYTIRWLCEPPPPGVGYRVEEANEEWSDDFSVRTIRAWSPAWVSTPLWTSIVLAGVTVGAKRIGNDPTGLVEFSSDVLEKADPAVLRCTPPIILTDNGGKWERWQIVLRKGSSVFATFEGPADEAGA